MHSHKIQFTLKISILQMNKHKFLRGSTGMLFSKDWYSLFGKTYLLSPKGAIYAKDGHSPSGKTSSLTSPEGA
jgi:hypothetical protein